MQAGAQAGAQVGAQVGAQAGALAFQCNQPHTRTCRRRSRAATLVGATETHDVLASLSAGVVKQSASRILCARGRRTAIAVTRISRTSRSETEYLTKHSDRLTLNENFNHNLRKPGTRASKQASTPGTQGLRAIRELLERSRFSTGSVRVYALRSGGLRLTGSC